MSVPTWIWYLIVSVVIAHKLRATESGQVMDIVIDLILFFAGGAFGYWIAMREGHCRKKRICPRGET
jgi:hypothetical protein